MAQKQEGSFAAPLKTGAAQDEEILVKTLRQWLERRIERRASIKHQISKINGNSDGDSNGNSKAPDHTAGRPLQNQRRNPPTEKRAHPSCAQGETVAVTNPQVIKTIGLALAFHSCANIRAFRGLPAPQSI